MQPIIQIQNMIYTIRGQKIMLDSDLAFLYEVETKALNRAVKRNMERFPGHFMFQLTKEEWQFLRCQFGTSKQANEIMGKARGGRQYLPYAFTEQGVAMLSSVLRSKKAIQTNIQIMDTFVRMRKWAIENNELAQRLTELEEYFIRHCKDNEIDMKKIYETLTLLTDRTKPTKIGFKG